MSIAQSAAEQLNRNCHCTMAGIPELRRELALHDTHPHLFSDAPVFIDHRHLVQMRQLIAAVYRVARLPGYQNAVASHAPDIAAIERATLGVFTGFDFHMSSDGPRLIEINTNAGGALLNAAVRARSPSCCADGTEPSGMQRDTGSLEREFVAMFLDEWRAAHRDRPLRTIAIVDDQPATQYLHPEFVLFESLFERHGFEATIEDAGALEIVDGALYARGRRIDLVYNRLTDFYFAEPRHRALKVAYETDAAVVTPHPRAHALLASKRNLTLLSSADFLRSIGASADDIDTLERTIPRTVLLEGPEEKWWSERKDWFFKPVDGFGSRGVYRGDKITRRVFAEILRERYVAQRNAPASERWVGGRGDPEVFKLDIRCFAYEATTQLVAARLYRGQTTNFRTPGGGFARVFALEPAYRTTGFQPPSTNAGSR